MNSWKAEKEERLLTFLKNKFSNAYTTKDLQWTIEHNRCWVNGKVERFGSARVRKGDEVAVWPQRKIHFIKEKERILYEDTHLFFYNKPPSLSSESLAKLLDLPLVHRLDRDTTGVMVFPKSVQIKTALENLFRRRRMNKEYLAWVEGCPKEHGEIVGKLALISQREGSMTWGLSKWGLSSITKWKRLETKKGISLVRCLPLTGRTHQIRVHLKSIGHPIIGDVDYNHRKGRKGVFRPLLHAESLVFIHPFTKEEIKVSAPLPSDFFCLAK